MVLVSLTAESLGGIFTVPPRMRKRVGFLWLDYLILKLNSVDGAGGGCGAREAKMVGWHH